MSRKAKQGKESEKQESSNAKANSGSKITKILVAVLILVAVGVYAFQKSGIGSNATNGPRVGFDPAKSALVKGGESRPTLNPARFVGQTAAAYKLAGENRELLDNMYCYCYCAMSIGHKSLLSCFADTHATNCKICQDQAFYAASLAEKRYDVAEVRKRMDQKFWRPLR